MNFKGTTNIPRDQVKGIIEQFGGSWNGYTWIDQTTYLETATRDALDRMLFIESERMASCLYHPDDCESERTVIISELQGGENDPDQLLDQELTATAFKAHPYRHPTIGWLSDLRDDDPRRSVRLLPPLLRPEQRHAGRSSATSTPTRRCAASSTTSAAFAPGPLPSRLRTVEPEQTGERRLTIRQGGHDGVPEGRRTTRPRVDRPAFLPAARPRRGADRREGSEPLVQLPRAAAAAQRAAVSRARRARPRLVGVGRAAADRAAVSLHGFGDGDRRARRSASVESALLEELDRVRREGITDAELAKAKAQLQARLVFDNDSVTNIAHQLGYFETIASVDVFDDAAGADRGGDARRGRRRRARDARRRRTGPSAGSIRCRSSADVESQARVQVEASDVETRASTSSLSRAA